METPSTTQSDFSWLCEHSAEVWRAYRGRWIAVHAGEFIGVGDTAVEADEAARRKRPEGDFILEAVDAETDVVYAGF